MNNAEEATKVAKNTRFAILTRQAADTAIGGGNPAPIIAQLNRVRLAELQSSERLTAFAAIGRQLGDAHRAGRDYCDLLAAAISLRRIELGTTPKASQQ